MGPPNGAPQVTDAQLYHHLLATVKMAESFLPEWRQHIKRLSDAGFIIRDDLPQ